MEIIKLVKNIWHGHAHYYVMFDEIPEMTYEQVGSDYVGSYINSDGKIVFSHFLKNNLLVMHLLEEKFI